ncbi:MAG: pentapeptide repeat-containing protein [Desulfuromonadales bacterium]
MKYTEKQLALLRERWLRPLVSPDNGEHITIEGASTFQELLAQGMSKIHGILNCNSAPDPWNASAVDLSRNIVRKTWEEECDLLFSEVLENLRTFGLEELFPIETPRYQIRDSCDLRGASLRNCMFRGAFLENVNFEGADLSNACFVGARCFETHFENALCEWTNFSGAECHFAVFSWAKCDYSILDKADCTMAHFDHTTLRNASFHETISYAATFNGAFLANADISSMKINHLTHFGLPGDIDDAKQGTPTYTRKKGEEDDWYIVDLFPAWLRAAQVNSQIRFLLRNHGYFLEADEYQYLEMVCQRNLRHHNRLKHFFEWFFKDLMFGYGLKWKRPLISVLTIILVWALGFALHFRLNALHGLFTSIGYGLYYSVIAFTTLGFGNAPDLEGIWPKLLLCSEALLGTVLMPLFLLAYARKILQD